MPSTAVSTQLTLNNRNQLFRPHEQSISFTLPLRQSLWNASPSSGCKDQVADPIGRKHRSDQLHCHWS